MGQMQRQVECVMAGCKNQIPNPVLFMPNDRPPEYCADCIAGIQQRYKVERPRCRDAKGLTVRGPTTRYGTGLMLRGRHRRRPPSGRRVEADRRIRLTLKSLWMYTMRTGAVQACCGGRGLVVGCPMCGKRWSS